MAEGCLPINFLQLYRNAFYFEVNKKDLEGDTLSIAKEMAMHLSHSPNDKYLILNSTKQFEIRNLTEAELLWPESIFNILIYKSNSLVADEGRPVMLYIKTNGKKMVAYCTSNNEIHAKEMEPPKDIKGEKDEALFCLTKVPGTSKRMFESTLHQGRFLALEHDNTDFLRLVLREKKHDVDEFCQFSLT